MEQDGRRATLEANRGNGVATTNKRDMDGPNEDASNASDERRIDEVTQDRRENGDGQTEDRDENEGTNDTAAGGAAGQRRITNSHEDTNRQATRTSGQPQI